MNEQKNNGRGIFYGVIGVATLVIAIIGATFAYFTATATAGNNVITGNMATITFDLKVEKASIADEKKGGMIPMSNSMVEKALDGKTDKDNTKYVCTDDNGNAVCQIYKIIVENTGSASLFLDGYVTLEDDVSEDAVITDYTSSNNKTSMRWAQAFCTEEQNTGTLTSCTTAGITTTRLENTSNAAGLKGTNWDTIDKTSAEETAIKTDAENPNYDADYIIGTNSTQILTTKIGGIVSAAGNGLYKGNNYDIIDTNFIRTSDHAVNSTTYDRDADVTSALVYNQPLAAADATNDENDNLGDSTTTYTDAQVYYIVVWFTETGKSQNRPSGSAPYGDTAEDTTNPDTYHFFNGSTTFISAQGSEVTATFNGFTRVGL